jgi:hypothetical protein
MRTRGPILTLLSMVALAFALLAVNMTSGVEEATDANLRAAGTTTAPPAAPPPVASPAFPELASYAGRTSGRKAGEATVEIAIRNGAVTAYLCDGKKLESWLQGSVTGSSMTLRGKGTDELTGNLRDGAVSGAVSVGSARWQFTADRGPAPDAEKRAAKTAAATERNAIKPTAPQPDIPQPAGTDAASTATTGATTWGAGQ